MSEPNPVVQPALVEILAEWEGPAIHEPGALFEETQAEHSERTDDVATFAAWIAVTAVFGEISNAAQEAINGKVCSALAEWRRRFGQSKIDEVKQQLLVQMERYRNNRKMTDEELRGRIDLLFRESQV
jgi:hypothetical protein